MTMRTFLLVACLAIVHQATAASTSESNDGTSCVKCSDPCALMKCATGCIAGEVADACKVCPKGQCCPAGHEAHGGKCVAMSCDAENACTASQDCVGTKVACFAAPCPQFKCVEKEVKTCQNGEDTVEVNWEGKGFGTNWCNSCSCIENKDGTTGLVCTRMGCEGTDPEAEEKGCTCGETCKTATTSGVCQADGKTCANNIQAPSCPCAGGCAPSDYSFCNCFPKDMAFDGKGISMCNAWGDNDGNTGDTVCAFDAETRACVGCNVLGEKACTDSASPNCAWSGTEGKCQYNQMDAATARPDCTDEESDGSSPNPTCAYGADTVAVGWKGKGFGTNWCNSCSCMENKDGTTGLMCTKMGCVGTDPEAEEKGCTCGETCKTATTAGVCQADGVTCASNKMAPQCTDGSTRPVFTTGLTAFETQQTKCKKCSSADAVCTSTVLSTCVKIEKDAAVLNAASERERLATFTQTSAVDKCHVQVRGDDACLTDASSLVSKFGNAATVAEMKEKLTLNLDASAVANTQLAVSEYRAALNQSVAVFRTQVERCNAAASTCGADELAEFEALVAENEGLIATTDYLITAIAEASRSVLDGSGSGADNQDGDDVWGFPSSGTTMTPIVTLCAAALVAAFMGSP